MKIIQRIWYIGLGLMSSLQLVFAQTFSSGTGELAPAPAWPPDTVINDTAQSQGLQVVPPGQVPPWGTFWIFSDGGSVPAPLPCSPGDTSQPIFAIADSQFLVGDAVVPTAASAAVLAAQAIGVMNLIAQIQSEPSGHAMQSAMAGPPLPPGAGGSGVGDDLFTNSYSFKPNTNELWLTLTNVNGGLAYLNLYVPTNLIHATNQVYAIWVTTNLLANWQVAAEVWLPDPLPTTNPVVIPFTLPTLGLSNLFVRAEDWTGVTENGNTIPDWWFWKYFGTTALSDTNLDSLGRTLLYDYQSDLTPSGLPVFTQQPVGQFLILGDNAQFNAGAYGIPAPTFQWHFNSAIINGATNASLYLANFQTNNLGTYFVVAANRFGAVTSSIVKLAAIQVYAGPAQSVNSLNSAVQMCSLQLHGVVSDGSGNPAGGSCICTWSVVSAPANSTVTFVDANLTNSIVTINSSISAQGAYVLSLTAFDGQSAISSEVVITVTSPDILPYAGTNYLYIYAANDLYTNFYTTNYNDSHWSNGVAGFGNNAQGCFLTPNTDWPGHDNGYPFLYVRRHFNVPAGTTNLNLGFTVDNDAQIFLNGVLITPVNTTFNGLAATENVGQAVYNNGEGFNTNLNDGIGLINYFFHNDCCAYDDLLLNNIATNVWHLNDNILAVRVYDDGDVSFFDNRISLGSTNAAFNQAPVVEAGQNQFIDFSQQNQVDLSGTVIDDGLPGNGEAAATWSEVSGPDTNVLFSPDPPIFPFTNYVAADETVTFDQPGTYKFQLVANDSALSSTGYVTVVVGNGTVPVPLVNLIMPTNNATLLPETLQITATASAAIGAIAEVDFYANKMLIGRAINYPYTINWINPPVGIYQLQALAADTAGRVGSSTNIIIEVNYGVYAGPDLVITNANSEIQSNSIQLQGVIFVGDANVPTNAYTATWTVFSGPNGSTLTFADANVTNTTVLLDNSLSDVGTYHLRLTLSSDNGQLVEYSDVLITITTADVIPYAGTGYRYAYATNDIFPNFYATNFDDTNWDIGQAGFGNNGGCPLFANTYWPGYGYGAPFLYVRRHFTVPAGTTNLSLGFTVDNDAQIFLNGVLITPINTAFNGHAVTRNIGQMVLNGGNYFSTNYDDNGELLTNYFVHSGCCAYDDMILDDIATNVWHLNDNVLSVRVYDDGGVSFFDNRVSLNLPGSP